MKRIFYSLLMAASLVAATGCEEDLKATYEVTFDSQGGSTVQPQTVEEGSKLTKPADPTKGSETFEGWYKEAAGTNRWDFSTDVVMTNLTLYAKWSNTVRYTVTFNSNGGSSVPSQQVAEGRTATRPANPTKASEVFDIWCTDSLTLNEEYDFSTPVRANLTLHARWFTVNVDSLRALMDEFNQLSPSTYTNESWSAAWEKYDEAYQVANSSTPTPEAITSAYVALRDAMAALVTRPHRPAVGLEVHPVPINGKVYVTPGDLVNIQARCVDSQGYLSTNDTVTFAYNLTAWADGEVNVDAYSLSFLPLATLTPGTSTDITIQSAENPGISQTITLWVVGAGEIKALFLDAVATLPDLAQITLGNAAAATDAMNAASDLYYSLSYDEANEPEVQAAYQTLRNYQNAMYSALGKLQFLAAVAALPEPAQITQEHEDAIDEAFYYYQMMDNDSRNAPEVQAAYQKLQACAEALNDLPIGLIELSYSFNGNIVTLSPVGENDPIAFTYAQSNAFPYGTYTSGWEEDGDGNYMQNRIVLNSNGTTTLAVQMATNAQGSNATGWMEIATGTYYINGSSTSGTLSLALNYSGGFSEGGGASTNRMPKQKAAAKWLKK